MTRALDLAMGWIVAIWLLLAIFNSGYAPYLCMGGAMLSVIIWAGVRKYLTAQPDRPQGRVG